MNELSTFQFEKGREFRILERDGDPWFMAKDVCDVLDIGNPTETMRNFPENEILKLSSTEFQDRASWGGASSFLCVNEPGLYRLIFQSRKPEAEAFKTWVFTEVLPSIRKKGYYRLKAENEKLLALQTLSLLEIPQDGEYRYKFFELSSARHILDWLGDKVAQGYITRTEMLSIITSTGVKESYKKAKKLFVKAFVKEHVILTNAVDDFIVIEDAYSLYKIKTLDPVSRQTFTRAVRKHFRYNILEWVKRVNGKPVRVFVSCLLKDKETK